MSLNKLASQILPLYAIRLVLAHEDQIGRSREHKKAPSSPSHTPLLRRASGWPSGRR